MKELKVAIKEFIEKNNLSLSEASAKLGINEEKLKIIDTEEFVLDEDEIKRVSEIIEQKPSLGKKIAKILDLLFRMGACIMALVALLLCINGIGDYKVLIVLLSIGLVCSSIISLPKINK